MRRFIHLAAIAALVVLGLYVALLAGLYAFQRRAIYPGWWRGTAAVRVDTSGYRNAAVITADGLRGRLLYSPPRDGKPVILFFHGNGDSVLGGVAALQPLVAVGYGAVVPEYRGYNGNPGTPDEQGLYADARAARAWMTANHIAPGRTIIVGYSIGSGVAVQSALETRPAALILVAAHAGIARVVADRLPFVPTWLVSERFDNAAKIGRLACPILLIHGIADGTIPVENARVLATAQPRTTMVLIPGAGHEVVWNPSAQARIAAWLKDEGL